MRRLVLPGIAILLGGCGPAGQPPEPVENPRTLVSNVRGYTWTDSGLRTFAALEFTSEGTVTALHDDPGPETGAAVVVDGQGATLVPGLIDAHGHVDSLGLMGNRVDLVGTRSLQEALQRIANFATANPQAPWILGRGWNQVLWSDPRFPTAADLEQLQIDRPIWLRRIDGHAAWANRRAMVAAGIDDKTADPHGGRIERNHDGAATGLFIDTAMNLVEQAIPAPSADEQRAAIQTALQQLSRLGITSVHDAGVSLQVARLYQDLAATGELPIRVYVMLAEDSYDQFGLPLLDDGRGFLAIRSIKAYLDGALGSRGAALLADYSDDPGNSGLLFKDVDQFERLARDAAGRGFQVNVHAIGDRANRVALEVYGRLPDTQRLRHRIEHAQIIAPADLPMFARNGVIASMQPIHATSDMNMAEDRVGPRRIPGGYAWRSLLDSGARIAAGSDFPVEPANPMYGLHAAVTRTDRDGNPAGGWYAAQALSPAEALRLFTLDAAFAAHQERQLGSLEPGKRADFVLLDHDIVQGDPQRIWQTRVLQTWVDGKQVYPAR